MFESSILRTSITNLVANKVRYKAKNKGVAWILVTLMLPAGILVQTHRSVAVASTPGAVTTKQQVAVPEAMLKNLDGKAPEAKERRTLAQLALQQYLRETLLGDKVFGDGTNGNQAKLSAWIGQNSRGRFDVLVPSFNVKMSSPQVAEVKLVVSRQMVFAELEKAGLGAATPVVGNSVNSNNAEGSASSSANGGAPGAATGIISGSAGNVGNTTALGVPFAAFLVDEKTHDVYVTPSEAVPAQQNPDSFYHFKPANILSSKPSESQLNSVESALADRAAVFALYTSSKLSTLKIRPDTTWAREVVQFLEGAGRLQLVRAEMRVWPPPVTFAASTLVGKQGVVAIFTVRNAEKSGVLEKFDVLRFAQGQLVRSYWSRSIQDPAMNDKVPKIFDRMTAHFLKQVRSPKIENSEGVIRLIVDKKLSEKDLTAVETILRTYVVGTDNILVPYEVTRADVRYFTPVVNTRIDRVLDRIKKDLPSVHARVVPGEGGYLTLAPQSSTKQAE